MSNLDLYEKVRAVPKEAMKTIEAGRLKGKTDINPMWRIKTLTESFGVCGVGWYTEVTKKWLEEGSNGEVVANVELMLYIKQDGEWSKGIYGIGGAMFISNEKGGKYTDDDCFKKAYTDAISVACKALGIGADVYYAKDATKYDSGAGGKATEEAENPPVEAKEYSYEECVKKAIRGTPVALASVHGWIKKRFGREIAINDLSKEQYTMLMEALEDFIKR